MARTVATAQVNMRAWSLSFKNRSTRRRLRADGFFAGHETKEELKEELRRLFWEQKETEPGENLGHYLETKPSANAQSFTSPSFLKGGRSRKVCRGWLTPSPLDSEQGEHVAATLFLPVSYLTRSAEKKAKLAADEKRKSAATEKRRFFAEQKKRKLAADRKLYSSGIRWTVTRSCPNSRTHSRTELRRMAPEATDDKTKIQKLEEETAELRV